MGQCKDPEFYLQYYKRKTKQDSGKGKTSIILRWAVRWSWPLEEPRTSMAPCSVSLETLMSDSSRFPPPLQVPAPGPWGRDGSRLAELATKLG